MSGELVFAGDPAVDSGKTVTATVYDNAGTVVGSSISCTEAGSTAIYVGDMPVSGAGTYIVRFFDAVGLMLSQVSMLWDGSREVTGNPAVDVVEGTETLKDLLILLRAEALGKVNVIHDTVYFRDAADTKDRIVANVDRQGRRLHIVLDPS